VAVPLFDTSTPVHGLREELRDAIARVLDSERYILGPEVSAFEHEFAAYCGATHAVGVANGTDAITIALRAMGVGPGDEVVVPSFTFYASAEAIPPTGATPVFCDIDPDTYCVTAETVRAALSPRTKAVIAVHLFGNVAPIAEIQALGVPVLEDAAQAAGSICGEQRPGALGTAATFSFFPSKNLGGFGDGGMVTTSDDALAATLRAMRMHGETSRYHHKLVGGNFRLDALQAAVLHVKLPHLDGWAGARRANAKEIERRYLESGGLPFESGGVKFPREAAGRHHVFNQFVVRVGGGRRDSLKEFLEKRAIGAAIYYPVPLHLQECFASLSGKAGDFPESERAAKETLALPVFPELTEAQKAFLAATLAEFSRGSL
jgi:dTDP-3-amino-3,4,6-trideoxy-alpha-D-glucose transaminase